MKCNKRHCPKCGGHSGWTRYSWGQDKDRHACIKCGHTWYTRVGEPPEECTEGKKQVAPITELVKCKVAMKSAYNEVCGAEVPLSLAYSHCAHDLKVVEKINQARRLRSELEAKMLAICQELTEQMAKENSKMKSLTRDGQVKLIPLMGPLDDPSDV